MTSQKEQLSNSVFLNERLARSLTGRPAPSAKNDSSFMNQFSTKNNSKNNKASAVKVDPSSEDEDSRSKSIGKRPLHTSYTASKRKR